MPQSRKLLIQDYEDLLEIQLSDGTWDENSYMHGMANGMILFHSMAKDPCATPTFKDAPMYWKSKFWQTIKKSKKLWLYFQWIIASIISIMTGLEFEFKNNTLIAYQEK